MKKFSLEPFHFKNSQAEAISWLENINEPTVVDFYELPEWETYVLKNIYDSQIIKSKLDSGILKITLHFQSFPHPTYYKPFNTKHYTNFSFTRTLGQKYFNAGADIIINDEPIKIYNLKSHRNTVKDVKGFSKTIFGILGVRRESRTNLLNELEAQNLRNDSIIRYNNYPSDILPSQDLVEQHIINNSNLYQDLIAKNKYTYRDQNKLRLPFYPIEVHSAFVQLVAETTLDVGFLSEKTIMPLLYGKPFIALGAAGIYSYLKDAGFLLYDELFDYSFDNEANHPTRIKAIVNNLVELSKRKSSWNTLYNALIPKLQHNSKLAIKLGLDTSSEIYNNLHNPKQLEIDTEDIHSSNIRDLIKVHTRKNEVASFADSIYQQYEL